MSNAAKHRKKAAEFEQLKQIDRAIASYILAIEHSESEGEDVDVALLNKVGDLTLRQGRVADAVTYYERAVEHYAVFGLFNNAIALCNKILRSAPGRSNVYFTLGRICGKKGLRGDATRNFLEYATRMQQEGRVDEGMRALAEVADLMPELTEIRRLVEEHAIRVGIELPRRKTPAFVPASENARAVIRPDDKSKDLIFLDVGISAHTTRNTPPLAPRAQTPPRSAPASPSRDVGNRPGGDRKNKGTSRGYSTQVGPASLDPFLLFDPTRTGSITPIEPLETVLPEPVLADVVEPVIEAVVEQVVEVEAVVEPMIEAVVEPEIEAVVEPEIEAVVEPAIEAVVEPVIEAVVEPVVEAVVEPVVEAAVEPMIEPVAEAVVETVVEPVVEPESELTFEAEPELMIEQTIEDVDAVVAEPLELQLLETIEGLEISGNFHGEDVVPMVGLSIEEAEAAVPEVVAPDAAITWLMPTDVIEPMHESTGLETTSDFGGDVDPPVDALPDLVIEDFDHVADNPKAIAVTGGRAGTPAYSMSIPRSLTPIEVSPIPELDAAIADGELTAALANTDTVFVQREPPFRLDPHDFILPGELPPLMVDEALIEFGLQSVQFSTESMAEPVAASPFDDEQLIDDQTPLVTPPYATAIEDAVYGAPHHVADTDADADADTDTDAEVALRESIEAHPAIRTTPSLPIAAVAAEANVVATSRCEELRAAVARTPQDWMLRRRLAEALLEAGERDAGLSELQASLSGFAHAGQLSTAAEIADELVHIHPERIQYHQKRVELSVRLNDQSRLRIAYLDLADTLVRSGEDTPARAVYARVLELDPWDERALAALGSAAPPPPQADDESVNLAEWLKEDEPGSTRMRMREPVVSGDEQADFDALLRHFKEGVSRSLGEEDYESHYDLGVAYKEMGLLDDAIAEFQKALRSRRHRLAAYEALGQCFVEQSRHSVAATVLTRAMHEPGLGDEQRVGVLYLLAYSCEALQRWDEARSYYSRVYATDNHFRDVAARLAALDLVAR